MRILFFTDNFPPETNAPASRTYEHTARWVKAGHQVTVVTCAPNFPFGKVFEGYRNRLFQREFIGGIEVIRIWSFMSSNSGFALRVIDYLSYMFMASLIAPFLRRPDIIIGTSPQFFALPAAWFTAKIRRVPWILELRDLWPESVKSVGAMTESWPIRLAERLEMFLYRSADRIVTVTQAFKRILTDRGIDPKKMHVVTNGVDLSRYTPRPKDEALIDEIGLRGKVIVGYVGTHGMAHDLITLLDAAEIARSDAELADLQFLFVGDGAERTTLESSSRARGLTNVRFIGAVSKDEIVRYWSILDLSIVHLKDDPLFASVIPSKIFECMGMGVPILIGVRGEALEIVEKVGAGVGFTPGDATDLVGRIKGLISDHANLATLSNRARASASDYDRSALADRMLSVIEEAALASSSPVSSSHPSS